MEDPAAGRDPPQRRRRAAERQRGGEDRRRRLAGGEQRAERRRIAAGGGEVAEGEVDAADEAVDQRIGGRQQRVDRRQRQAVERLLQRIGGGARQARQFGDVAERGRVGVARFRRRQPEADEEVEADVAERPAVDRQRDHFVGAQRPAGLAEAAVGEMGRSRRRRDRVDRRRAGRARREIRAGSRTSMVESGGETAGSAIRQRRAWSVSTSREQPASAKAASRTAKSRLTRRAPAPRDGAAWRGCRRLPSRTSGGGCSWSRRRTASRRRRRRIP